MQVISCSLADYLSRLENQNILLVTTAGFTRRGLTADVMKMITKSTLQVYDGVRPNPDIDDLDDAAAQLHKHKFSTILAIGGGSVIDTAKAFSIALPSAMKRPITSILKEGQAADLGRRIPVVAVPTTSGTGSEVTQYATVWDSTNGRKLSLFGEHVFPVTAVLDPSLGITLPQKETLYTGLDTISHALESIWNINSNPFSELYATSALNLALDFFPAVLANPANIDVRAGMQNASLFAGYAISITKTAISHAISYPLTAKLSIPHGLACGFTLSELIRQQFSNQCLPKYNSLLSRCSDLLLSFDLNSEISQYASAAQIINLLPEMLDLSRINNYNLSANISDVSDILNLSLTR